MLHENSGLSHIDISSAVTAHMEATARLEELNVHMYVPMLALESTATMIPPWNMKPSVVVP